MTQADLGKDYFALFGLPARYDLDDADLAARYRELQRRFHPDKYASATDQERRLAVQLTAHINEAFQTLRDPVTRGRYMLRQLGIDTGEDTDTRMNPAFLMQQMELREELEELGGAGNSGTRLEQLSGQVAERLQARIAELGRQLASGADCQRERCRELVREMQFLKKVLNEIDELVQSVD